MITVILGSYKSCSVQNVLQDTEIEFGLIKHYCNNQSLNS